AELKDGLLDVLTRFCSHGSAGAFTSRKCHSFYYRVRYDSWDLILVDDKALKCPHRKARFNKDFLNVQSTAKNVGCVFQHTNVTRHQGRRRETEDLPEGEVPRHNGEDGSERIVAHIAPRGVRLHRLVCQKRSRMFRVVLACPGAFFHFSD